MYVSPGNIFTNFFLLGKLNSQSLRSAVFKVFWASPTGGRAQGVAPTYIAGAKCKSKRPRNFYYYNCWELGEKGLYIDKPN